MSITVIIPTHQTPEHVLSCAISSALACQHVERVLVIDDGSEPAVVLSRHDPRVELIRQTNAGPAAARNTGLDRVLTDWALLLDDDDELIPEGIADAHTLAVALHAAAAVVGRVEVTRPGASSSGGPSGAPDFAKPMPAPSEWAGRALPRPADVFRPITLFNASGTLIARSVLDAGLRYDTTLKIGEDREFLRRVAEHGPIAVAPSIAVRAGTNARADRLTSASHLERRAQDHLAIMRRWLDAESEPHFREATRWLLNAMSKRPVPRTDLSMLGGSGGVLDAGGPDPSSPDAYTLLLDLARERKWLTLGQELKLGLRHALRGVMS